MSKKRECLNCMYSASITDNCATYFACCRHAPMIIHGSGTGWAEQRFPKMDETDWCGDWEAKHEEKYYDPAPVSVLPLGVRAKNAVTRGNIKTVGDLERMIEDGTIYFVRLVGDKTVGEIKAAITEYRRWSATDD